jgi:HAD superfamily hydrolase (TIGR01509 family)
MHTTTFIFDIGNVMIDFDLPALQRRVAVAAQIDLRHLRQEWSSEITLALETGKIDPVQGLHNYSAQIGLLWTYDEWISGWADVYELNSLGRGLYEDLHQRGYRVAMLSNLAEFNMLAIARKFPGFFDVSPHNFFSYELGLLKPDPQIYRSACQRLQTTPEQCVFLDDVPENVAGAHAAGMHAIQFTTERAPVVQEFVQAFL